MKSTDELVFVNFLFHPIPLVVCELLKKTNEILIANALVIKF
jgi:hypothetical protein